MKKILQKYIILLSLYIELFKKNPWYKIIRKKYWENYEFIKYMDVFVFNIVCDKNVKQNANSIEERWVKVPTNANTNNN